MHNRETTGIGRRALAADIVVGIISDTHGVMRPKALAALRGTDLIIHAGDVGKPEVLEQLRGVAPTFVVRGYIDTQSWGGGLAGDSHRRGRQTNRPLKNYGSSVAETPETASLVEQK